MCHMPTLTRDTTVAVIGAGAMGAGIAQVAATAGHPVAIVDAVTGAAEEGRPDHRQPPAARGQGPDELGPARGGRRADHPVDTVAQLPQCGLVVEAVREDLDTKRDLFSRLAASQPQDAVLATNTSSLDITAIADGIPHPDRVLGLHFFNPPPLMRLVEVVSGGHSSAAVLDEATDLMRAWGKTPVRCTSTPGFIVNRVARPFYGESQRMLMDGVADAATLDAALRSAGFRMGPLELTDFIGQDVNLAVGTSVWEQTGRDPRYEPTRLQQDLVAAGHLGRKTGQGVYRYGPDGRALEAEPDEARLAEPRRAGRDPVTRTWRCSSTRRSTSSAAARRPPRTSTPR